MGNERTVAYMAECFWPGVTDAALEELDTRVRREAAATRATDAEVRYQGTILVPEDEVVFCFFDGPSVEAVQAVAEQAAIPFSRIVGSTRVAATSSGRREEP